MTIREIWRRITATRYTRALEAEIGRLRAENRALLNSILGIAGIPPIPVELPDAVRGLGAASSAPTNDINCGIVPDDRAAAKPGHSGAVPLRNVTERDRSMGNAQVTPPMRRRSWQQITRMLEFESARKAVTSD